MTDSETTITDEVDKVEDIAERVEKLEQAVTLNTVNMKLIVDMNLKLLEMNEMAFKLAIAAIAVAFIALFRACV